MLHHKLKALGIEKLLSQQEVADAMLFQQNTYSNIERGKTKIDFERLKQFAEFYNKPLTYFLDVPDVVFDTNIKVTMLITDLEEQLKTKDNQIEQLLWETKELILQLKSLSDKVSPSYSLAIGSEDL